MGLVITYTSAGILNFAFGAEAYFVARMYYYLHTQENWAILPAAVICIFVASPVMGIALWSVLFRFLRQSSTLIKVVATIGLSVALPPIATIIFGNVEINTVPGLAPEPVRVFQVFGTPVTLDQVIILVCLVAITLAGVLVLRFTDIGLRVRALVDSEALTSLSGTDPTRTSLGVWAFTTLLAGLSGILVAPILGLTATDFTLLMASAFAAVLAARLRYLSVAVVVGLLLGVAGDLLQEYVPPQSVWASAAVDSVPFAFVLVFLIYYGVTGKAHESGAVGGFLDRAIAVSGSDRTLDVPAQTRSGTEVALTNQTGSKSVDISPDGRRRTLQYSRSWGSVFVMTIIGLLPLFLSGFWVGLMGEGLAFGVVFLSYTLITGEGGMIWLCQITFAGVGALTTAQLATNHNWPIAAAILAGGLVAVPLAIVLAVLTIRLGDLYIAVVTLTFGILMDNLVFSQNQFFQYGAGVSVTRPLWIESSKALTYAVFVIFIVLSLLIVNLRRSTTGLALSAVRWSEEGARTIGINVLSMKVIVSGLAAFVAGVGGGLLALYAQAAIPTSFSTILGLTWLAVIVTVGVRSSVAAAIGGLMFAILPAVFLVYLPQSLDQVPAALFGLGAILVARNPDGTIAVQAGQLEDLLRKVFNRLAQRSHSPAGIEVTRRERKVPSTSSDPVGENSDVMHPSVGRRRGPQ